MSSNSLVTGVSPCERFSLSSVSPGPWPSRSPMTPRAIFYPSKIPLFNIFKSFLHLFAAIFTMYIPLGTIKATSKNNQVQRCFNFPGIYLSDTQREWHTLRDYRSRCIEVRKTIETIKRIKLRLGFCLLTNSGHTTIARCNQAEYAGTLFPIYRSLIGHHNVECLPS